MPDRERYHILDNQGSLTNGQTSVWPVYCLIFDHAFDGHSVQPKHTIQLSIYDDSDRTGNISFSSNRFGFHPENYSIDIIDPFEAGDYNPYIHGWGWSQLKRRAIQSSEAEMTIEESNSAMIDRMIKRVSLDPSSVRITPRSKEVMVKVLTTVSSRLVGSLFGSIELHVPLVPGTEAAEYARKFTKKRKIPGEGY